MKACGPAQGRMRHPDSDVGIGADVRRRKSVSFVQTGSGAGSMALPSVREVPAGRSGQAVARCQPPSRVGVHGNQRHQHEARSNAGQHVHPLRGSPWPCRLRLFAGNAFPMEREVPHRISVECPPRAVPLAQTCVSIHISSFREHGCSSRGRRGDKLSVLGFGSIHADACGIGGND
jgi:hypothetical protein